MAVSLPLSAAPGKPISGPTPTGDPWDKLPFTAREWARQALLPYRQIPLKDGGAMSVQQAYDLYLAAGQPDYPDMATPGLVTEQEIADQIKLSVKMHRQ
jgi:hypothetical protein